MNAPGGRPGAWARAGWPVARVLLALLAVAACGRPATLRTDAVLRRGALAYDAAVDARARTAAVVELRTGFELVSLSLAEGRERWRVPLGDADHDVVDVALDAAGDTVAVASRDGTVKVLAGRDGARRRSWRLEAAASAVALSPDGRLAVTGAASGVLCLRRVADGALLQCVAAHDGAVTALAFCVGDRLASTGADGRVVLWDVPSLAAESTWQVEGGAHSVAFSPGCERLAVARGRHLPERPPVRTDPGVTIELREPASGRIEQVLAGHQAAVVSLAFTGDGRRLVSGSWDRTVRVWDLATGAELSRAAPLPHLVRAVAPLPGGRILVAGWAGAARDGAAVVVLAAP